MSQHHPVGGPPHFSHPAAAPQRRAPNAEEIPMTRVREIGTDNVRDVHLVDARELIASGAYEQLPYLPPRPRSDSPAASAPAASSDAPDTPSEPRQ